MFSHTGWRIPDRVFFGLGVAVTLVTAGFLLYVYPALPDVIPTHYGLGGQSDATAAKNVWTVFFPVFIQVLVTTGFALLYRYPRFASIPGTVLVDLAPEPVRSLLFRLIRHSLVITLVLMDLIFAYIALTQVSTAVEASQGINAWIIAFLIGLLTFVNVVYTVWFYRIGRSVRQPEQPHGQ